MKALSDLGAIAPQVFLPTKVKSNERYPSSANYAKFDEVTYMMVQAGRNDDGTDPWTATL